MRKNITIIILIIFLVVSIWISAFGLIKYKKALEQIDELKIDNQKIKTELKELKDRVTNCIPKEDVVIEDEKDDSKESRYPDFTNGSYEVKEVQDFCDKHNLKLEVLYDEPDGTQIPSGKMPKADTVFFQMPAAGEKIVEGDTMTIKIARY